MVSELEKLLGAESEPTPPSKTEEPKKEEPKVEENPEIKAKAEQLANLNKAIAEEQERLKKIREERKSLKPKDEEEELPSIDFKDPAAKAWKKQIDDSTAPAKNELEKAKEERRIFALKKFLSDKPSLAKNPEKVKAMMETYDRLKTSTELTSEGIEMDLEKAYAAEHAEELISAARQGRLENARNDALMSDIAVSRGSTSYSDDKPKKRVYTDEEKAQLAKWGMTPEEHAELLSSQKKE